MTAVFKSLSKAAFLFLLMALFSAPLAFAQDKAPNAKGYQMKVVFPMDTLDQEMTTCPQENKTRDGCCPTKTRIYTSNGIKGCCQAGRNIVTFGANQGCCNQCTGDLINQTESTPCGNCCAAPRTVVVYNAKNFCCTSCPGTRYSQNASNGCGTCCSTGSSVTTYGAKTDCCTECDGTRWAQTNNNVCGNCCPPASSVIAYGGTTACCASCQGTRWGQTTGNACGGCCGAGSSVVTHNGATSCCKNLETGQTRSYQTVSNVCGTVCQSATINNCGPAGSLACTEITGSRWCSQASSCSAAGEYITGGTGEGGYTCNYKPNPCGAGGSWELENTRWSCAACYRNNARIAFGSCAYNGTLANAACTAKQECVRNCQQVNTSKYCSAYVGGGGGSGGSYGLFSGGGGGGGGYYSYFWVYGYTTTCTRNLNGAIATCNYGIDPNGCVAANFGTATCNACPATYTCDTRTWYE